MDRTSAAVDAARDAAMARMHDADELAQALDLRVAELLAAALDLRAHGSRLAMHLRSLAADLVDTIAADADIRAQAEEAHAPIAEPADYGYDCATCHISDEDWS